MNDCRTTQSMTNLPGQTPGFFFKLKRPPWGVRGRTHPRGVPSPYWVLLDFLADFFGGNAPHADFWHCSLFIFGIGDLGPTLAGTPLDSKKKPTASRPQRRRRHPGGGAVRRGNSSGHLVQRPPAHGQDGEDRAAVLSALRDEGERPAVPHPHHVVRPTTPHRVPHRRQRLRWGRGCGLGGTTQWENTARGMAICQSHS